MPDYDGRGEDPATAGEVALWVPRILLSPLYLVSEFVIRRPLGWLLTALEREQIAGALWQLFHFGPNNEIAVVPTLLLDLGFKPTVGVYARYHDFLAKHNKLNFHFLTGTNGLRLALADRYELSETTRIQLKGEFARRSDGLFYGVGLNNQKANQARYAYRRMESVVSLDTESQRSSTFRVFLSARDTEFNANDTCCDGPSLAERIADETLRDRRGEALGLPQGFGGYTVVSHGAGMLLDHRQKGLRPDTGVQLKLHAEYAFDAGDPLDRRWVRYGATPALFVDLTGSDRTLRLDVHAATISTLAGEVPFSELIDLGDDGPLKAFVQGWVIGESAAALSLSYNWPIWAWLDGSIHGALGNAFGRDFADFDLQEGRFSTGIGVHSIGDRDHAFTLLLAFGTEPLADGGDLDTVRFLFGGIRAF